jgi:sialidase-1
LAGIDIRWRGSQDNPNHISIGLRRSEDGGESWSPLQILVQYPGDGADGAAAIDSALLEDRVTGTVWMLFSHTPGGIGLWQSRQSVGFDRRGRRLLYDEAGEEYYCDRDGAVYDQTGNRTRFQVEPNGDVRRGGEYAGNIYLKETESPRSLLEARTSFLQAIKSEDDGVTWSPPIDLNPQVKQPWMKFLGAGPGRGLQLVHGPRRGRLVFPVYFSNPHDRLSNAVIYSDDHGQTWKLGCSPNDGREWEGETVFAETLASWSGQLTESQVVELPNGELKAFIRNHSGTERTAVAVSRDGGETWGEVSFASALVDPICQSSVIAYPGSNDQALFIWANPAHPKERVNGTVRMSLDGGDTWPFARTIEPGDYGYSCLTVLPTGEIGLLYEGGGGRIYFTKFTLQWIQQA